MRMMAQLSWTSAHMPAHISSCTVCQGLLAYIQRVSGHAMSIRHCSVQQCATATVGCCHSVCSQALKWGQDKAEHSNFRLQLGHSKPGHIAKHGALPSVLTRDAPEPIPAVPGWCSLEATPGPGAYEPRVFDQDAAFVTVQRSAFGASGANK